MKGMTIYYGSVEPPTPDVQMSVQPIKRSAQHPSSPSVAVGDQDCSRPPAQTPACGTTAPGSSLVSDGQTPVAGTVAPARLVRRICRRCRHVDPGLSPERGTHGQISVGYLPWLHRLRDPGTYTPGVVRRDHSYYEGIRLPTLVHRDSAPVGFFTRSTGPSPAEEGGISRLRSTYLAYMRGVSDHVGFPPISCWRWTEGSLPDKGKSSAPQRRDFSRLNGQPICPPTNACTASLQTTCHSSGSVWVTTPSLYGVGLSGSEDGWAAYLSPW